MAVAGWITSAGTGTRVAGDLDIGAIVRGLEEAGYPGWYVLEQDVALTGEPPAGTGPVDDVRRSLRYLAETAS